jgi:EmrB/QacA subfamily drug resistance transporter
MLYRIVPREKMGMAMGIFGIGVSFAPALGPTLGGYLVEYVDWRLIFYINVPFGLIGVVAAYTLLPRAGQGVRHRFDWWGFITVGTGLFALLLAFSKAEDWHWGSYRILLLLVFGTILLALFVVIELERDDPLIQLRVLRSWPFVNSLLLITVLMVGLQTILFYLPLFLQNGQRMEALPTGVLLLPEALVMAALMPVAGALYDKFGPRWPAAIGLAIAAYGTYLLCGITANMTQEHVVLWTCVRAAGNGLALMPIMTAGLAAIPAENTSSGTTLNNLVQRVSGSIGLAAMTVIADNRQSQIMADRSGLLPASSSLVQVQQALQEGTTALYGIYQQLSLHVMAAAYSDVFYVCAIVSAVGVFLALDMRKPQPPATAAQPEATAPRPAAPAHHEPAPGPTPADDAREPADAGLRA